jgi:hypothetical protein
VQLEGLDWLHAKLKWSKNFNLMLVSGLPVLLDLRVVAHPMIEV